MVRCVPREDNGEEEAERIDGGEDSMYLGPRSNSHLSITGPARSLGRLLPYPTSAGHSPVTVVPALERSIPTLSTYRATVCLGIATSSFRCNRRNPVYQAHTFHSAPPHPDVSAARAHVTPRAMSRRLRTVSICHGPQPRIRRASLRLVSSHDNVRNPAITTASFLGWRHTQQVGASAPFS